jgi:hypothetical protein
MGSTVNPFSGSTKVVCLFSLPDADFWKTCPKKGAAEVSETGRVRCCEPAALGFPFCI